ncbi:ER lumen protein retaining receptor-domain-containing protein [Xylariaceae sp. FL0016]|nr:ER lumen protein retaining receptor-domain-containing protein [Xylariaceae sp. FL0016]
MGWNIFRIMGDISHLLSKCILISAIHRNRSAEGVSMITQGLYAVVFCSRYTDIFTEISSWNFFFKLFYIITSIYIIVIMRWLFPRTREREIAWKLGALILAGSLLLSPFVMLIFEGKDQWAFFTWVWDFSQILESICVLPQLLLLRQTTVPTVIDSFYLLTLGAYRALYCLNWIWREFDPNDRKPNAVSVIFGIIQTALYVDFFWVYYTRQRVKLRYGGVVDADDIRRGWLLRRIFGNKRFGDDGPEDDEESAPALGGRGDGEAQSQRRSKWGARGISISADDTTLEQDRRDHDDGFSDGAVDPDAKMRDPDELAHALDDDEDEDGTLPGASNTSKNTPSGVNNGSEWRDS